MIPRIATTSESMEEDIQKQENSRRFSILAPLAPYALLVLFTLCLLWPLCFGRTLYWGDILLYFGPMSRFTQHELLLGRLPLWNPYILCGQPFIGNPQMSVFYPSTLLLAFFPSWLALNLSTLLHLFLCGAFAFCFLRRWTLHTTPALAGACVYMGSACVVGRLQFPPMAQTAAYFPLLLAVLDRNIDRPSLNSRVWLCLTVALTLFAAHTQVAYLAFTCGVAYSIMRLWRQNLSMRPPFSPSLPRRLATRQEGKKAFYADARRLLVRSGPLVTAALLGLLLAAIYLVPAVQLLHESPREQMSIGQTNRFFTDAPHLLTLLFPRFAGHPVSRDFWARGNAWEPAWFVGWIPLAFIGYAIARCSKENLVRFWSILVLLGVWLSLGSNGGLFTLCFYIIPGLANFHDPARFLLWTTLGFAVLTAVGLDAARVRTRWFTRRMEAIALIGILLPLWWFNRDWNPTTVPAALDQIPRGLDAVRNAAGKGRIAMTGNTVFWRHTVNDGYMDYGNSDPSTIAAASNTLLSNLEMRFGLQSASGYEPVPVAGQVGIEGLTRVAVQRRDPVAPRLLGLLNVQALLLPVGQSPTDGRFQFVNSSSEMQKSPIRIYRNRDALPRAWLTRNVRRVEGKMRIAAALTAPDFDPVHSAIVSGSPLAGFSELEWGGGGENRLAVRPVIWQEQSPIRIRIAADAGSAPAFLVYSATGYPGWKAFVDNRSVPLRRADGNFIGVPIPTGKHDIQLIYSPDVFRVGMYLSLTACGALAALAGGALAVSFRVKSKGLEVNGDQ